MEKLSEEDNQTMVIGVSIHVMSVDAQEEEDDAHRENNADFDPEGNDLITGDDPTDKAEAETVGSKDVFRILVRTIEAQLWSARNQ